MTTPPPPPPEPSGIRPARPVGEFERAQGRPPEHADRYGFPFPDTVQPDESSSVLLGDLYAWTCIDPSTNVEGIIATAQGMPAIGDQARVEGFRDLARLTAQLYNAPVRLVRFDRYRAMDVVNP